jgi:RNA polymerase sigma-70 factor (ECF subfamily)
LHTILRRLAIDRARHARRWRLAELPDDTPAERRDSEPGPRWSHVTPLQLEAALQRRAAADREVFYMHYVQGMRYREIAGVLGVATGTVATRLHRARTALRAELERELKREPHGPVQPEIRRRPSS